MNRRQEKLKWRNQKNLNVFLNCFALCFVLEGAFESSDSNVVKTSTSTSIKTTNGKKVTTVTVVQTMADGSTKTTVNTTTEGWLNDN